MPSPRQTTFQGGEWSPSLYGANHLDGYRTASRLIRNMVVSKYGTLVNRPGTVFCAEVKDSTKLTRLLPFNFSDDQAYAIEVGDLYARVFDSAGTRLSALGLLALGNASQRSRSYDAGATWATPGALPYAGIYGGCTGANGRVVVCGTNGSGSSAVAYSDDLGANWTGVLIAAGSGVTLQSIAYNGRRLVAAGYAGVTRAYVYSDDNGVTWSAGDGPTDFVPLGVAWGNGRWIAVGYDNSTTQARYSISYDGKTWGTQTAIGNLDSSYTNSVLNAVCYASGQFHAVGRTINPTNNGLLCSIGMLVSNWTWSVKSDSSDFPGVATDGVGTVVCAGSNTAGTAPKVYKYVSSDGTWNLVGSIPAGSPFLAIAYHRGYFVMVGGTAGSSHCSRYDGTGWTTDPTLSANGAYSVLCAGTGTAVLEVSTPYPVANLRDITQAQSGDVATMFHRAFPPKQLKRYGVSDWRLEDWYKQPPTLQVSGLTVAVTPAADATHPAKEWQWVVSWIDEESGRESKASAALTPGGGGTIAIYPDKPATIRWNVIVKASRYYVYRGRNGDFGFVGTVAQPAVAAGSSPTTVDFRDDGREPIYSDSPRTWNNPFQSDLSYPACGCYFDDRFVTGGSSVQPSTVLASAVGDYYNHDENVIIKASDSFEFTLAARRYEQIRWFAPLEKLIAGTSEGEWVVSAAGDEAIAFDSIIARERSARGSRLVQPVVIGEGVLYVQAGGQVVRDFAYSSEASQWGGTELSRQAQHLLDGYTIVDWAYAKEPRSVLWLVRSDGALLSLTFLREQQMWAWARHDVGGAVSDTVEAVTCIPNGAEDVLFLIVKRTINGTTKRYVERLGTWNPATGTAADFLDCSLVYSGASTNTVTGLTHLEARTVGVWAGGSYRGTYVVASGSVTFTGAAATYALVGIPITAQWWAMDFPEAVEKRKIVSRVGVEVRTNPTISDTAAGLKVGQDLSNLGGKRFLSDADGWNASSGTGILWVPVDSSYNPGGQAAIEHTEPWPLEIRGVTREIQ